MEKQTPKTPNSERQEDFFNLANAKKRKMIFFILLGLFGPVIAALIIALCFCIRYNLFYGPI